MRGRRAICLRALGAAALLAPAGGCASFEDPSTVQDLRVLAVATEPSEIILDADPANLGATVIPDVVLTPLVIDPRGGGRPALVTVKACANDPAGPPPPNTGPVNGYPSGGASTTVGSALCDGDPAAITVAEDVDLAATPSVTASLDTAFVAAAFQRDVFPGADGHLHGGFDLGMPLVFQITVRAGGETVRAVKRVILWAARVRADQMPNQRPQIPSVRAYDRRDEATAEPIDDAVVPLDAGTTVEVAAGPGEPGVLWVDPAPAAAEPYVTAVIDRLTGAVVPHDVAKETLRYQFFATAGKFSPFETSSEPPPGVTVTTRVHIESKYQPPPVAERPADVTVWIVVRDERGGVSWVTRSLHVAGSGP